MELVLLCGGRSKRMGSLKGLLPLPSGCLFIQAQCQAFLAAGGLRVVAVFGFEADTYIERLNGQVSASGEIYFPCQGHFVHCVINQNPEQGAFSSLQVGLAKLLSAKGAKSAGIFVLPIDVPCPSMAVLTTLRQSLSTQTKVCVPVFAGRGGHPVLLSTEFCTHLLTQVVGENYRLDYQIAQLPVNEVKRVDVSESVVCYNLNKPEDWQQYLRERKERP